MSVVLIETVGAVNANTYATQAEADAYFAARLPLTPPWEDAEDPTAALAMAARILDAYAQPFTYITFVHGYPYYRTRRRWTGSPATTTQRLAWPRTGMFDMNGNAILPNVIPEALKDAQAELAAQLVLADTTLDNEVITQGITGVKAGSVAVSFKNMIESKVLPDAVWNLMPPSWFTLETMEPTQSALLDVIS